MRYCFADCLRAAFTGILFMIALFLIIGGAVTL